MVTVRGCIQQVPPENYAGEFALDMDEVVESADTYLEAVAKVEANVPAGWRLLYCATAEPRPT